MNILLVNKYHFAKGGADRAYLDMGAMLERAGHSVAYFSMKHSKNLPTPWERYFVSGIDYENSDRLGLSEKIRAAKNIIWNREAEQSMSRLLDEFHPDIVHMHNIYHQLSPSILRPIKKRGIPIIMTLHDYKLVSPNYSLFARGKIWEETKNGTYWTCVRDRCVKDSYAKSIVCAAEAYVYKWIGAYHAIQTFLSPSKFLIEKFKEFGFTHPIEYFPNPLVPFPEDFSEMMPAKDAPFLFLGRLSAEKGIDTLLRGMREYSGPSKLFIAGEGPERENLEALTEELGIGDRIRFLGYLSGSELEVTRKLAKAILIPSRWYENMPYVLTESLGAGKIVVAADRGGIPERIRHGENGFLFDPEDTASIAKILREVDTCDVLPIQHSARVSVDDLREAIGIQNLVRLYSSLCVKH